MFKKLLLPTDGSAASEAAVRKALDLAREGAAEVIALHVVQPFHVLSFNVEMIEDTREVYERHAATQAQALLTKVERAAREFGVPCQSTVVAGEHPYEVIIRTAEHFGCDLIVMASHGRRGADALLLGSETQKVLTHCKVPVLVLR